jgi:uncharacterized RDD family membrane protein YckC
MEQTRTNDLIIASVWKRAIAFAIDILIIILLILLLIPLVNWILQIPIEYSLTLKRGAFGKNDRLRKGKFL